MPKKNDKIILSGVRKNIIKCYLIGKNTKFFLKQIQNKEILTEIKLSSKKNNTILLSPAAASFDQFVNFEKRGDQFKKLSKLYARKFI